jgi:hypothetical protein
LRARLLRHSSYLPRSSFLVDIMPPTQLKVGITRYQLPYVSCLVSGQMLVLKKKIEMKSVQKCNSDELEMIEFFECENFI